MKEKLNLLIWGTGNLYQIYKERFEEHNILALIDNAFEKKGIYIDNKVVIAPEEVNKYVYDYIVILVQAYEGIYQQALDLGVSAQKIITTNPEGQFSTFRKIRGDIYNDSSDVILISHEMNLRGAPLMLYEVAKILKKNNIKVSVAGFQNGELKKYYNDIEVPVFEFDDFKFSKKEIKNIFAKYKVVLVNTLALSDLIFQLEKKVSNIVWWIHEEWSAYDILKPNKHLCLDSNVRIYGVGERAKKSFGDYYGKNILVNNLQWGIENKSTLKYSHQENDRLIFAIIGEVCRIKGQDILIDVIKNNYQNITEFVEFWIIGKIDQEMKKTFEQYKCIKVFGELDHKDVLNLYANIDVVLSTSRNDTMSVVLVEGMMNKKIIMTSTGTGVSDYIVNHYNGLVYESENIEELSKEIVWVLNNRMEQDQIRERGYQLYNEKFSMKNFQKKLLSIIEPFI